jgi:hypothetical protein
MPRMPFSGLRMLFFSCGVIMLSVAILSLPLNVERKTLSFPYSALCVMNCGLSVLFAGILSTLKYNAYNPEDWTKAYFDERSGGFNVHHKEHQFTSTGGGGEAEKTVGEMLAKLGKQVEFLPETRFKKSPDISFDGQTWDIKYIDHANEETVRAAIRNARKADNALFYFTDESKSVLLNNAITREAGRFLKGQTNKIPDIYGIDKNGFLKLIWRKQKGAK